jgi:hypothetical protein
VTVQIRNVSADIRTPPPAAPTPAAPGGGGGGLGNLLDAELRERLRPIVMDILNSELEALLRRRG